MPTMTLDLCDPSEIENWRTYQDILNSDEDFHRIHDAFHQHTQLVKAGKVGDAECFLMPVRELVDFAVGWMNANRPRSR